LFGQAESSQQKAEADNVNDILSEVSELYCVILCIVLHKLGPWLIYYTASLTLPYLTCGVSWCPALRPLKWAQYTSPKCQKA